MFKKEKRFNQPFPPGAAGPIPGGQFPPGQYPQDQYNAPGMYPQFQTERLQVEIMENRRRINNLARRVGRIENYLRIHETPDGGYMEENSPTNFSF